jgi:hypothetical protein
VCEAAHVAQVIGWNVTSFPGDAEHDIRPHTHRDPIVLTDGGEDIDLRTEFYLSTCTGDRLEIYPERELAEARRAGVLAEARAEWERERPGERAKGFEEMKAELDSLRGEPGRPPGRLLHLVPPHRD